jgi:hypothetical protein
LSPALDFVSAVGRTGSIGMSVPALSRRLVMPSHKLTLLGHPAFKAAQQYLHFYRQPRNRNTRVAFANGVIAISGDTCPKRDPAEYARYRLGSDAGDGERKPLRLDAGDFAFKQYKVDISSEEVLRRFNAMIRGYNVKRAEEWLIDNCA